MTWAALALLGGCTGKQVRQTGIAESTPLFQEPFRPQIHFSPMRHWMNDPNGMVYYAGEYHLFYQHNPDASVWGPMHWGHAVSRDLVRWEHLPIALYPDSLGYIFSGSAVVDWKNTSGFGKEGEPPLIAFFTYHDKAAEESGKTNVESQAIAYSTDRGRTWTKFEGNPVIQNPGVRDFRDPKVVWHEPTRRWIMAIAAGQEVCFYTSPDCKSWSYASSFGEGRGSHDGTWECPDLFPIRVNGSDETKWVLLVNVGSGGPFGGSATQYFVGDFDGKSFSSDQGKTLWSDYGFDDYACVTWSDAPDQRRIAIGWMTNLLYSNDQPTEVWRGSLTFPREIGLDKVQGMYLLTSAPVKELDVLKGKRVHLESQKIEGSLSLSSRCDFPQAPVEVRLTFDQSDNTRMSFPPRYGVTLKNGKGEYITIGYDNLGKFFYVDRTNAVGRVFSDKFACMKAIPYIVNTPEIEWTLLIDVASVEFFTAGGRVAVSDVFFPSEPFDVIEVFAEGGILDLKRGSVTELKSIWKK